MIFGCLLFCNVKFQTEVVLSTTDEENITLSHALSNATPLINLNFEIIPVLEMHHIQPIMKYGTLEDNKITILFD